MINEYEIEILHKLARKREAENLLTKVNEG